MPDSLKDFIKKKLKENVSLSDIEYELIKRGYAPLRIGRAVHEAVSANKKLPVHTLQIIVLVVGIVMAVGVAVYLTSGYKGGGETKTTSTQYSELCKAYPAIAGEISCEDAIKFALEKYSGKVDNVNKTTIRFKDRNTGEVTQDELWVIRIAFDTPRKIGNFTVNSGDITINKSGSVMMHEAFV